MLNDYRPTHDPNQDTFKVEYLIGAAAVLGIIFPYSYTIPEILWAFSIWLESVAILPQLFMLQRTGEAETITTHYLFALGIYRALYIPNWLYRYFIAVPSFFDPIAVVAGVVQTVLYSDFFYIYYTKYVESHPPHEDTRLTTINQSTTGQEIQPPSLSDDAVLKDVELMEEERCLYEFLCNRYLGVKEACMCTSLGGAMVGAIAMERQDMSTRFGFRISCRIRSILNLEGRYLSSATGSNSTWSIKKVGHLSLFGFTAIVRNDLSVLEYLKCITWGSSRQKWKESPHNLYDQTSVTHSHPIMNPV